jgi:hypothetical protein
LTHCLYLDNFGQCTPVRRSLGHMRPRMWFEMPNSHNCSTRVLHLPLQGERRGRIKCYVNGDSQGPEKFIAVREVGVGEREKKGEQAILLYDLIFLTLCYLCVCA